MKRDDLVVGETYYVDATREWNKGGWSRPEKVVVVDTGHWEQSRWGSREPRKVSKGSGVLVETTHKRYNSNEIVKIRSVVNLMHIRGLYEETVKMVAEATEKRNQEYMAEREAADQQEAAVNAVVELAEELGIKAHGEKYGTDNVVISASELQRLLNAAANNL